MNGSARILTIALATSVALSSTGCASRAGNGAVIIAGGMFAIKGAMVSAQSTPSDDSASGAWVGNADFSQQASLALVLLGVGLMAAGGIGLMQDRDATDEGVIASHAAMGPMGTAAISESDRLGIRATRSAQAGDCAAVRLDVTTMHAMDPEYASALVGHDEQIRACMNG